MDHAAIPPAGSGPLSYARCAVYARTSRETEAEPIYSSIEAQRDACYAHLHKPQSRGQPYVLPSPAPPPRLYADAGFSGATLQRPALQRLLADVAAGLITVVAVYKIDRLSRSLTQFSRLMDIFDRHAVQLLSVSQHLDSQHPEGRLVINALMAFAQFERELTSERQLHKIRATRRRGLWTGGAGPLGYDAGGQRLVVNQSEADVAVKIFERFVALRSMTALVAELADQSITTKTWVTRTGKPRGGLPIDKNYLYKLLNNRTLLGEMKSGAQWLPGAHAPIIRVELWEQAHALLSARRRSRRRKKSPLIFQ